MRAWHSAGSAPLTYSAAAVATALQGHVMFYGQAAAAAEFFSGLGYVLPYGVNAADFLLDLASGDVAAAGR